MKSAEEVTVYWNKRHAGRSRWHAGGDLSLSKGRNELFYQIRLSKLLVIIWGRFGSHRRLRVLDAGCGVGWLAHQLLTLGYHVEAIDAADEAVQQARQSYGLRAAVADLDQYTAPESFQVVLLLDVLFHITDDALWSRSLFNLASLLAPDGVLLFTDDLRKQTYTLSDYIIHRCWKDYEARFAQIGMRLHCVDRYGIFGNPNRFYVAEWA